MQSKCKIKGKETIVSVSIGHKCGYKTFDWSYVAYRVGDPIPKQLKQEIQAHELDWDRCLPRIGKTKELKFGTTRYFITVTDGSGYF